MRKIKVRSLDVLHDFVVAIKNDGAAGMAYPSPVDGGVARLTAIF